MGPGRQLQPAGENGSLCVHLGPTCTSALTQPSHQSSPFCMGETEAPRGKGGGMTRFAESLSGVPKRKGLWADINSTGDRGRRARGHVTPLLGSCGSQPGPSCRWCSLGPQNVGLEPDINTYRYIFEKLLPLNNNQL